MRASGQAPREWCEKHGIKFRTFRNWIYSLKRLEAGVLTEIEEQPAGWIEVSAREVSGRKEYFPFSGIEVCVGSCVVSVRPGFDRELFIGVCEALREIC
jgi:hypothetical protein